MSEVSAAEKLALKVNKILDSRVPVILFIGKSCRNMEKYFVEKPWSCVVTTLHQEKLLHEFTIENKRRVSAIDDKITMVENAKLNQRDLNIVYVFGQNEETELSVVNKRRRDQDAASMLNMLPDMVKSNFGYLVIVGYGEADDGELDFSYIFDTIELMRKGSVYMFGVPDSLWHNELFIELQKDGKLEAVGEDLPELLRNLDDSELLAEEYSYTTEQDDNNVFFYINGKRTSIGLDDLFETRGFITLVSETEIGNTSCPAYLKKDYFYNFLRNSPQAPIWYGYENAFNLIRNFEDGLKTAAKAALQSGKDAQAIKPILLSGQTSSGKSMALGNLAFTVYREQKYPVLYIKNPDIHLDKDGANFSALDMLIQKLENMGARKILLIWDNSSAFNQRREAGKLYTNLQNRGRKVALVCSGYDYGSADDNKKFTVINALIALTLDERRTLRELVLANSDISNDEFERWASGVADNNLLTLLYNLLHEHIGEEITQGVGREANFGLDMFFSHLNNMSNVGEERTAITAIGTALQNAGFNLSDFSKATDKAQQASELVDKIRNLFIVVAVSSQHKIALPFYMALRTLKLDMDNRFASIQRAIEDVPCLRVVPIEQDDSSSEYLISFRTPLEAHLYLRSAGVTPEQEINHIARLIIDTASSAIYSRFSEIATVDKLIRAIGPNSDRTEQRRNYSQYYDKIVDALSELRTKYQVYDPRLVCQEVTWLREIYGVPNQEYAELDYAEKKSKLENAIQLAKKTVEQMMSSRTIRNNRALGSLVVEQVLCELRLYELSSKYSQEIIPITFDYRTLFTQLSVRIGVDPTNIYQRNALMKLFFTFYDNVTVTEEGKLEYLSKMLSIVDSLDSQVSDLFDDDEYKRHTLKLKELESKSSYDDYFEELLKKGNAVGVHLKARRMLEEAGINLKENIRHEQRKALLQVREFIKLHEQVTKSHSGCQYMLLVLTWLLYNGSPPFSGDEMQRTAMNSSQWREILTICEGYEQQFMRGTEQAVNTPTIYYLLALAHAQLEDFSKSLDAFKQIERIDGFYIPVRNKVWHLLCDEQGTTKKFRGNLEEKYYDRMKQKGRIRVENIGGIYFYGPSLKLARYSGAFQDIEIGTSYIGFEAFRKLEA